MTNPSWAKWWAELKALAPHLTDPRPWRHYFEDGYTPQDALAEDNSYED